MIVENQVRRTKGCGSVSPRGSVLIGSFLYFVAEDAGSRDAGSYRRNSGDHSDARPNENVHPSAAESIAEEADLLDVDNWDDVPSQQQQQPLVPPNVNPYGQQQAYGQAPPYLPQQQPVHQNAMVPAANQPQAYPGAPPMPQYSQQQQAPPPPQQQQQQQQYPAAQQDPWATPGQQQQQPFPLHTAPQPYQPPQQMGF